MGVPQVESWGEGVGESWGSTSLLPERQRLMGQDRKESLPVPGSKQYALAGTLWGLGRQARGSPQGSLFWC